MPEELSLTISISNILMSSLPMDHSIELVDPSSQTVSAFGVLIMKDPREQELEGMNPSVHEHETQGTKRSDSLVPWL